ncbi:histidine triad (HIT) family protein [Lipingzhangella halophila]|uniref:Histidine triad (HIT) family protein n=1 Tax=Lipingzhangella halophila TaxID=1783352 RepID=A0A7W7W653_9ACTN|nr:HIT family protein [Lipingzhangella halophila]MBB4934559.1 histidine triad (HIT) family protein [Lipingzhangella halophila]
MSQSDHDCLFCAIVTGERRGHIVSADDAAVAFLDSRPLFKGHVLVVPVRHVETLTDLPHTRVGSFFGRVQDITSAVERGLQAAGTFVAMNNRVSQSVPHLHVHVVPRQRKDGLRGFFWPRTSYGSDAEADDYAARVRDAL